MQRRRFPYNVNEKNAYATTRDERSIQAKSNVFLILVAHSLSLDLIFQNLMKLAIVPL